METEQRPILMARPLAEPTEPDTLSHHGILGQKWGVRRFQNKDGTLTRAGKERYLKEAEKSLEKYKALVAKQQAYEAKASVKAQKLRAKAASKAEKQAVKQFKAEQKQAKLAAREVKREQAIEAKKERLIREANPDKLYKNRALFTDEELRRAKERYDKGRSIKETSDSYKRKQEREKASAERKREHELKVQKREQEKANQKAAEEKKRQEKLARRIGIKDIAAVATGAKSLLDSYNSIAEVTNAVTGMMGKPTHLPTIKTKLSEEEKKQAYAKEEAERVKKLYNLKGPWIPLSPVAIQQLEGYANKGVDLSTETQKRNSKGELMYNKNGDPIMEYKKVDESRRVIAAGELLYNKYMSQATGRDVYRT